MCRRAGGKKSRKQEGPKDGSGIDVDQDGSGIDVDIESIRRSGSEEGVWEAK